MCISALLGLAIAYYGPGRGCTFKISGFENVLAKQLWSRDRQTPPPQVLTVTERVASFGADVPLVSELTDRSSERCSLPLLRRHHRVCWEIKWRRRGSFPLNVGRFALSAIQWAVRLSRMVSDLTTDCHPLPPHRNFNPTPAARRCQRPCLTNRLVR